MWELYVGLEYYDYVYYHAERYEKIVKKQIVKIQKDEATALLNTSRAHIIRLLGDTQQQKAAIANMLFLKSVLKPVNQSQKLGEFRKFRKFDRKNITKVSMRFT